MKGDNDREFALFVDGTQRSSNIVSVESFGDCELQLEFLLPESGNSGVYLMGRYEVQLFDSFGRKPERIGPADCGGIYGVAGPRLNAALRPGEWQSLQVEFRAPRFDATGRKVAAARFVRVSLNGVIVQQDVDAPSPTGGGLPGDEAPTGPIMLQGDHTGVAFRNIRVRPSAGQESARATSRPAAEESKQKSATRPATASRPKG